MTIIDTMNAVVVKINVPFSYALQICQRDQTVNLFDIPEYTMLTETNTDTSIHIQCYKRVLSLCFLRRMNTPTK